MSDFTHIDRTVMRFGERIAEARNAANAQLIAEALNAYNPSEPEKCPNCGEQRASDAAVTHQQWECGCCGSWNAKERNQ